MTRVLRPRRAGYAVLAACAVVLGCDTDRSTAFEPVGTPIFDFGVSPEPAGLPSGTVTTGVGTATVTVSNLRALGGSNQYQFWVVGRDSLNLDVPSMAFGAMMGFFLRVDTLANGDTNFNPVTGDAIFVTDSTVVSATRTNAYAGSDDPAVTSVRVTIDSTADGSAPQTNHAVVVTLESGAATTPGAARFLWRRIGVGGGGAMLFGNFGGSDVVNLTSPNDYVFGARGSGLGGARGAEVSVDLREIARPPVGFFYRGYVVDADGEGVVIDTLRAAWTQDSDLSRVSLFDADVNDLLPGVVGGEIRNAQVRNCASGAGVTNCANTLGLPLTDTFVGYALFQLKLEPKGGVAASAGKSITHGAALPDEVQ
jgi:hypothetical protein